MEELEEGIISKNIGLCFMDSFGKLFGASGDMNTIEAGYNMYSLNSIAAKTGCAFVVAHHLKKYQSKHKKDQPRIPSLGDFFGTVTLSLVFVMLGGYGKKVKIQMVHHCMD